MRKFTKHILSVLLCVALCCTALSVLAFAASGETPQESGQAEAGGSFTIDLDSLFAMLFSGEADSTADTAEPDRIGTVVTGGSRLNLRSGGSTDYAVIGQLAPGDQVQVLMNISAAADRRHCMLQFSRSVTLPIAWRVTGFTD